MQLLFFNFADGDGVFIDDADVFAVIAGDTVVSVIDAVDFDVVFVGAAVLL